MTWKFSILFVKFHFFFFKLKSDLLSKKNLFEETEKEIQVFLDDADEKEQFDSVNFKSKHTTEHTSAVIEKDIVFNQKETKHDKSSTSAKLAVDEGEHKEKITKRGKLS